MEGFAKQFEKCVDEFGQNNAVLYCDNAQIINKLSYIHVSSISDTIKVLLNKFVDVNSSVGLATIANPILPPVILGIHKHHSAFVCIDIHASLDKNLEFFNRIGLKWVIQIDLPDFQSNFLDQNALEVSTLNILNYEIKLWEIKDVIPQKIFENVSYVIQTSGTTGQNKIVKVPHECIMPNINSLRNEFKITEKDIIYLGTPLTFDPFVIELFLTLTSGASLLIVPPKIKTNQNILHEALFPENKIHPGVTVLQMPPSVFQTFPKDKIDSMICEESSLRILALGGENFPENILRDKISSGLEIFNLYGITEVSCWASVLNVKFGEEITLGRPLDGTILEVRHSDGNVLENGEGEMYIGSSTRICEIDNEKITKLSNNKIFRGTGDIVKVVDSKKMYYIGRKNSIIKRFGHRVCLLEIEKIVLGNTELDSTCIWDEKNSKLILFVILKEADRIVQNKIIDKLRIKLLHCLTKSQNPDLIEIIPSLPLTQNGKTDLNCLLKIASTNLNINSFDLNPLELIQNLFSKYFGLSNTQLNEQNCSFLDLGGNSILAIQIVSEFEKYFGQNTAKLMEILLDSSVSYLNCCNFVEKNVKKNENCGKRKQIDEKQLGKPVKFLKTLKTKSVKFKIKWKHDLKACVDSTAVTFEHPTLGSLVVVGAHSHIFIVLNAFSGDVISQTVLPDAIEGSPCISPCKNLAMIGCNDGYMYCINIRKSSILWKFLTGSAIKCTPILTQNNESIIFGSYDKILYCISVKDGALVWKNEISEIVKAKPILNEDTNLVYVTTLQGSCFCICETTGKIKQSSKSDAPIFGSPCIKDERILWADVKGNVFFKKLDSFEDLSHFKADGFIFSSLCLTPYSLIFGCQDHNIYSIPYQYSHIQPKLDKGSLSSHHSHSLSKFIIGSPISSTPCLCTVGDLECVVVCSDSGIIHLLGIKDLELIESLELPAQIFSSPVVSGQKVYVGCRDNHLYCIEIVSNSQIS